jgi:hypothetical protein
MNKIEKIQEFNRKAIIDSVDKADSRDNEKKILGRDSFNLVFPEFKKEPITLNRVLIAINYRDYQVESSYSFCIDFFQQDPLYCESYILLWSWDLTKETLEEQSEKAQIAIAKLLGYYEGCENVKK